MRGRTVMVYNRPDGELVQVFRVGIEGTAATLEALLEAHPELQARHIVVDGIIDRMSAAFMELEPGEVRTAVVIDPSAQTGSHSVPSE